GLALIHNPLHGAVERVCAPRWHRARRRLQEVAQRLVDDDDITIVDVDRALVEDTASALWLKCAALFSRQPGDAFVLQTHVNWPVDAKQTLRAGDPWVPSATTGPVRLTYPDEAPLAPALAMLVVRRVTRHPASRLVLYGHHLTREQIDPDEIRILDEISRAAALAHQRVEGEAAAGGSACSVFTRPSGPPGRAGDKG